MPIPSRADIQSLGEDPAAPRGQLSQPIASVWLELHAIKKGRHLCTMSAFFAIQAPGYRQSRTDWRSDPDLAHGGP
jgi:hypothetical protein